MKKVKSATKIFVSLVIIGLLFSCSKNEIDAVENSFETDIIGVWELTSITSNGEEILEDTDCFDRLTFTATTVKYIEYFDFNDGNGCVVVSGQNAEETFPYSLEGSNLSWTDTESFSYEITELNATTLKLKEVYIEDGETLTDIETYTKL